MGPETKRQKVVATKIRHSSLGVVENFKKDSSGETTTKESTVQPKLKTRKLLPLLPRPGKRSSSRSADRPQLRLPGPCGIRACEKLSCTLQSHRRYAQAQSRPALKQETSSSTVDEADKGSSPALVRSGTITPRLLKTLTRTSGLPVLPLDEKGAYDPTLNGLFRDFFVVFFDRILSLLVSPFDGYTEWSKNRRNLLFQNAINTQLMCLNFVGAAYIATLGCSEVLSPESDATGILVHSNIMRGLRAKLEDFNAANDADSVLSVMYTLAMFDLIASADKQPSPLLAHRSAMVRVIQGCGGLHKIGAQTTLAMNMDRLVSVATNMPPLYTPFEHVTIPIQRVAVHPTLYGSFFQTKNSKNLVSHTYVLAYCTEVCRAIEILEGEEWVFDGRPRETTSEVYYFYYLRDRVASQFAHLNAQLASGEDSRAHCVLMAAKLVEYITLQDNYNKALTFLIVNRLTHVLAQQDLREVWLDCLDVLRWVVFVLVCTMELCKGKDDSLAPYVKMLCEFDDPEADKDWQDTQRQNVARFVWSWSRLRSAFDSACRKIEGGGAI